MTGQHEPPWKIRCSGRDKTNGNIYYYKDIHRHWNYCK